MEVETNPETRNITEDLFFQRYLTRYHDGNNKNAGNVILLKIPKEITSPNQANSFFWLITLTLGSLDSSMYLMLSIIITANISKYVSILLENK